jgi:hypothetical protein
MKSAFPHLPMLEDPKILKGIAKYCPITYRKLFGRKFILPKYREGHYHSLEFQNLAAFDRCISFAIDPEGLDDVIRCTLANTFASLEYNQPTLFLERELGEMLLRTPILADITTGDINWRWPAFRIVLPKGLATIDREDGPRTLTHFDVCHIGPDQNIIVPKEIAREVENFIHKLLPQTEIQDISRFEFKYKNPGLCISSALDRPDIKDYGQTVYGMVKPWGDIRLGDYQIVTGDLATPFPQDDADRRLLNRLEHIVINVLLFLSATPLEYQPEEVLRKARVEGSRLIPGLVNARFVGQSQVRPLRVEGKPDPVHHTGRHLPGHWVAGAWKRVAYGPKLSLRRLQWIQPYRTFGPEGKAFQEAV